MTEEADRQDMQGSDRDHKRGKGGSVGREARLAAKLRQNLVRRKAKARASSDAVMMRADDEAAERGGGSAPPDDNDQGA